MAWNGDGYLSSCGTVVHLQGPDQPKNPVTLHAIVADVSRYAGAHLNLAFAGKDAADFAHALTLGAKRLFGADRVDLHLLAGGAPEAPDLPVPTRANLHEAFTAVAQSAKPGDLFVIYLSGHGVMSPGEDSDYFYLTQEARGTDLSDPAVRALSGVSSRELTDWILAVPALKQVMILDTCAAGVPPPT